MKQNVNYILHHKNVNSKMIEDDISCIDMSIYNALFLIWNRSDFDTDLSIARNEIMKMSKVGNANTYTASLKKLSEKKYIEYFPSHNPLKGSKVTIIRFDKGSDKTTDNSSGITTDKTTGKGSDTLYKHKKPIKPLKQINVYRKFSHLSLSIEEYEKLLVEYSENQINDVLDRIENYKLNKNYVSLYLTAKNWLKKEKSSAKKESLIHKND